MYYTGYTSEAYYRKFDIRRRLVDINCENVDVEKHIFNSGERFNYELSGALKNFVLS
jgi:hypothetical protein